MISLLPNTTANDTHGVFAILAVIADPAGAQQRLTELIAEKQAFLQAIKDADAAAAEVAKMQAELERRRTALNSREEDIARREVDVARRERSVAAREATLREFGARLGPKVAALEVAVERLDDQCALTGQTLAIKIDVEEYEGPVIAGMRRSLTENNCLVQIESFQPEPIITEMRRLGYSMTKDFLPNFVFERAGQPLIYFQAL